jgi:peptide/nickel transport system substrate-binding protein
LTSAWGVVAVIEYRLLGPIEVDANGQAIEIGGLKQRALLAMLVLRANRPVPRDVLADQLWGEHLPAGAQHTLEVYISRLRKTLGDAAGYQLVLTRPGAYLLRVEDEHVDVNRFERLAGEGRQALAANAPGEAAADFRQALALWRGSALADLSYEPFAQVEIARLEDLRAGVIEDRVEADLALGHHADVVGELKALVAECPLRERLQRQLMVALYRCGRQPEALAAYQAARRTMVEELGIEPSPALQRVERAILAHDAWLDPPPPAIPPNARAQAHNSRRSPSGGTRRRRLLAVAGTSLAVTLALFMTGPSKGAGGSAPVVAGPNTVGIIDGSRNVVSGVVSGIGRPGGVAYAAGATWITDSADDLLLRVDSAQQIRDRIPVGRGPAGVAAGDGELWVANELDGTISEVNPGAGTVVATIRVGNGPGAIAFGYGSLWVGNVTDNTLSRIDAGSGLVVATIPLGSSPADVAAGARGLWVTSMDTRRLLLIDPGRNQVSHAFPIGSSPGGVAVGAGSVWVADSNGTVARFDPLAGHVQTIRVGGSPASVAYADGAVWVADSLSGSVARIDPHTGSIRRVHVGNEPANLAAAGHDILATVLPSLASHRGGTLALVAQIPPHELSADPAVAWGLPPWQILSMTNDGLVGYRRVSGPLGDTIVPDLATALPVQADGGKTYRFRLRTGIKYSNGVVVKPEDFRRAIERVFIINHGGGPATFFYSGISGAPRCERIPQHCDLAQGIVANDRANTVTFHLTAPDPEFLDKLTLPFADAVPVGTPGRQLSPGQLPATGPYLTQSFAPRKSWILARNPLFRQWSNQAQPGGYPDRIVLRFGVAPGAAVSAVEHGHADVLLTPPPSSRIHQLATRYASQLHTGPVAATFALFMNTGVRPFSVPAARRAVNYAIDRNQMIDLAGGPLIAQPACQILPPTMPGYQPYCPYTINPSPGGAWTAPNLARAEQLVRASGTRGTKVTLVAGGFGASIPALPVGRYLVSVLRQLGYRASLKVIAPETYYQRAGDSRDRTQIGEFDWYQDFPAPSDFIGPLFTCRSFLPDNPANINDSEFCNRLIDAQMTQARVLESRNPNAAGSLWARIDRELVDQAPWVPLYNPRALVVLSARVGNYQFHPFWTLLIDQLWVR